MAFPGELNLNYYQGDTHEFNVYPKKSDGSIFSVEGYSAKFSIAETRGSSASSLIEAYATISDDYSHIKCAIRPQDSLSLDPTKTYFYDVEITKPSVPYKKVHTVLTGSITITKQVNPTTGNQL
jgi:hypothetical protein